MVAHHSEMYGESLFKEQYVAFWRGKIGDLQVQSFSCGINQRRDSETLQQWRIS